MVACALGGGPHSTTHVKAGCMKRYVLRRILSGVLTVAVVFAINFIIIHLAPGNPVTTLMGPNTDDPAMRAALEEKYGLNEPLIVQFFAYLGTALSGDLGTSYIYNRPVTDMIAERVGATVLLGLIAYGIAAVVGTVAGIVAAKREGKAFDVAFSGGVYVASSMPSFWLGLMLIILFSSTLGIFPSYGMVSARTNYEGAQYVADVAMHMVLPVVTLIIVLIPEYFRIGKSSMLQALNEEYVTTLRATGMSQRRIYGKYVFRNAILPTVTLLGIQVAYLITGVTLIEIVFSWPGMGRLIMTAITQRDYPTLMGVYLVMSICVAVVMLVIDLLYAALDPRIRYE